MTDDFQSLPLAGFNHDMLIFGAGRMAGAMLSRWLSRGLPAGRVTAIRHSAQPAAPGVRTLSDSADQPAPSILLIGVKPQMFESLSPVIARLAGPDTLVLSIMAGIPLDDLARALPAAGSIVRLMPNMPVAEGRGVVARLGEAGQAEAALAALLDQLGHVHIVREETEFDLVSALTGCGPAFVYRFAAALAGAAVRLGLDENAADRLARATLAGAAATLAETQVSAGDLASAVASPGGMTQAGLDVLDSDGRLPALMAETLRAARDRGRELAAEARGGDR